MSIKYKVEGYEGLVRDSNSKAIVNTNVTEYQLYMQRRESRKSQINNEGRITKKSCYCYHG